MSTSITLVGLTGSLREQSVNRGVLRAVQGLLPPNVQMEILPLGEKNVAISRFTFVSTQ